MGSPQHRVSLWKLQACWTGQKQARPEPAWQRGELPTPAPVPVLCELGVLLGVSEHWCPPLLHQARIKVRTSPLASVRGSSLMLGNGICSAGAPMRLGSRPHREWCPGSGRQSPGWTRPWLQPRPASFHRTGASPTSPCSPKYLPFLQTPP